MMYGGGRLSNRLGRQPNAVHHLGDDHLIIHSALLGVAAGHCAMTECTTANPVRANLNRWWPRFRPNGPKVSIREQFGS